ncbi:hypothetical protein [Oscillatoria salina]|uniref:hypothetical protein n=1 Tax=Oscillatoria salina TaxID=331517 RepID=UPI0013B95876|nr:hypothetical protein [Oscillatoria salina]MBZ8182692.1 hypothetical protein [Oscillatoria salina IIICB1]NET87479.1 hypothetical protein [Kamptonema sp. SIO1D9]
MSSSENPSSQQQLLNGKNILYVGIAWGVLSLVFYIVYNFFLLEQQRSFWYLLGTYVDESLPFLAAALLCYRNWRNPQIPSGQLVWLFVGLGTFCYLIANFLFGWWELYWGLDPDVSPADVFYIGFYVFVTTALVLAVLPRRLNLELWHLLTVGTVATVGMGLAVWITIFIPANAEEIPAEVAIASAPTTEQLAPPNPSTIIPGTEKLELSEGDALTPTSEAANSRQIPAWIEETDDFLSRFSQPVNFSYIFGDVIFIIVAAAVLLAFWGGRLAQSWQMIAGATLSLYIADMWFKYVETLPTEYESGGVLEVFYVFSGLLFAIGAALEFDVSNRSRRAGRRRAR